VQVASKIKTFKFDGQELIPGVKPLPFLAHNIGCASYEIEDKGSKLIVASMNHIVLSVENPQFIFEVDYNRTGSVIGAFPVRHLLSAPFSTPCALCGCFMWPFSCYDQSRALVA
jgi:hypothetical protein